MSRTPTFRDFVPAETEVADGVEELCAQLEAAGWFPRSRWGANGVRYWPDNGRAKQMVIRVDFPIVRPRIDEINERLGLELRYPDEETA